jgi:adenylosuccinate synthase
MPVTLVVGTQWGDEGKGRIVDLLSLGADAVARFGGGANAGHTVRVGDGTYKLRIVPSGVVAGVEACIIGPGTVVSPTSLLEELDSLRAGGIDVSRVWLSDLAHLILPYHIAADRAAESARGDRKLGTTGNGIGPAYADRVERTGIRAGELRDQMHWRAAISARCRAASAGGLDIDEGRVLRELTEQVPRLLPHVRDTISLLQRMLREGKHVVAEGAQGTMLDVGLGTYPYVTSSVTVAGGAGAGLGIGPREFDHVVGVVKAYATRVGGGPFPTELGDAVGERLRERGGEFGVVTGRPRRCGWLDIPVLRYAIGINGVTHLAMTKLDVLDDFAEIGVCTDYDGPRDVSLPLAIESGARPIVTMMPGWRADTTRARSWDSLPQRAREYIDFIESRAGVPVAYVSVGPERSQIVVRPGAPIVPAAVGR